MVASDTCKTLKGISAYHSFLLSNKRCMFHAKLTCNCSDCLYDRITRCKARKICGKHISYHYKFIQSNVNNGNVSTNVQSHNHSDVHSDRYRCEYIPSSL